MTEVQVNGGKLDAASRLTGRLAFDLVVPALSRSRRPTSRFPLGIGGEKGLKEAKS